MTRIILAFALAFSAASFADEGDVKIRCTNGGLSGLNSIEFRETRTAGEYQIIQVQSSPSEEVPATRMGNPSIAAVTSEMEIAQSAKSTHGVEFALDWYWGNPNVLRMKGIENVSIENYDPCNLNIFELRCERL